MPTFLLLIFIIACGYLQGGPDQLFQVSQACSSTSTCSQVLTSPIYVLLGAHEHTYVLPKACEHLYVLAELAELWENHRVLPDAREQLQLWLRQGADFFVCVRDFFYNILHLVISGIEAGITQT